MNRPLLCPDGKGYATDRGMPDPQSDVLRLGCVSEVVAQKDEVALA